MNLERPSLIKARQKIDDLEKELAKAAQILNDAQGRTQHAEGCELGEFIRLHKVFPPSHPVWFGRPKCSCWKHEAGAFILKHANLSTLKV